MAAADTLAGAVSTQRLLPLARDVTRLGRLELRDALANVVRDLQRAEASPDPQAVDDALTLCRVLYQHARSGEALPVARAALEVARRIGAPVLVRRAASACGALCADTIDVVGAIEYQVLALRVALEADERVEASRAWGGIGLAIGVSGHSELAARCHARALQMVEPIEEPLHARYVAYGNLGMCLHRIGKSEEGLGFALRSLEEESPEVRDQDLHAALILRRNLVSILVACGRAPEAQPHLAHAAMLAEGMRTPRAQIAFATARATYELATGQTDVALTRLEQALAGAREVPATLRDTLMALVRAEEAAGNAERALARLNELSEHVYRQAIDHALTHVELQGLGSLQAAAHQDERQVRARLLAQVSPPAVPETWPALDRLAVSAVMRTDPTGWHGKRVGALVKALAVAAGSDPLPALEMGLAAELHDIGMISVPEGVLRKREPLNDAERAIVRRHVDAGGEILRDDRHPRVFMAREIARYHHARWDGEGYPEGVAGKRIPLAAPACAVADAYDAMVCGIGFQERRGMEDALGELHAHAGRQFDPELVDRFDNLIRTETEDLGLDVTSNAGMEDFQALVSALQEDRGFV